MPEELCTVEFAATQLKLHPKTILRFIREGRLRGTRVGKSYRILRADLDAFSGIPVRETGPTGDVWVTTIVDLPGVDADFARQWSKRVTSALLAKPPGSQAVRADVIYEPERSHLKIVIVGAPRESVQLLGLINVWLEQHEL